MVEELSENVVEHMMGEGEAVWHGNPCLARTFLSYL